MGRRRKTDWQLIKDIAEDIAWEARKNDKTSPDTHCRVSANVGDLMAAELAAAGSVALCMGGNHACETDYLAAQGATFPPVTYEEMVKFNEETLDEFMDEEKEFERYKKIARFFMQKKGQLDENKDKQQKPDS